MAVVLLVLAAGAVLAPLVGRRLGRRVLLAATVPLAVTLAWTLDTATGDLPVVTQVGWVPALELGLSLRADAFGLLMLGLVAGVGIAVLVFAAGYLSDESRAGPLAGLLLAFAGAMAGLVLADDLLAVFVFWELTSITSFLLIGLDHRDRRARAAALQALLTTGAGGLALLGGLVLLGRAAGTWSLSGLVATPPSGTSATVGALLVLLGVATKSAQVPFHGWLPAAMAAPTPVSAYLHSATMVKAGVYLVARLSPALVAVPVWRASVLAIGATSLLWGGYQALRRRDLKALLADSTIAQLGLLLVLFGTATPKAVLAGVAMLLAHALAKAALFLVVGIVDHATGTRDRDRLGGLRHGLPVAAVAGAAAAASMAGLPPLLGFPAKEAGLVALTAELTDPWAAFALVATVAGSVLTVAYAARLVGPFVGRSRSEIDHRPGGLLTAPAAVLASAALLGALVLPATNRILRPAAASLLPAAGESSLAWWAGWTPAVWLTALIVAAGVALVLAEAPFGRLQARLTRGPDAQATFTRLVERVVVLAQRVTAAVQTGSLPTYLTVILSTAFLLPGVAMIAGGVRPAGVPLADSPLEALLAVLVATAAVAVVAIHHRFAAVLALGVVGYAVAGLFLLRGAPDLALTQLLVETVLLITFALVLGRLPSRIAERDRRVRRTSRLLLAGGAGVLVPLMAATALASRSDTIADDVVRRVAADGSGRNVVNVVLTDLRAIDTLGEITVLAVAALGILALARRGGTDAG